MRSPGAMTPLYESRDLLTTPLRPSPLKTDHDEREHPAAVPSLVGVQGVHGGGPPHAVYPQPSSSSLLSLQVLEGP